MRLAYYNVCSLLLKGRQRHAQQETAADVAGPAGPARRPEVVAGWRAAALEALAGWC